MTNKDPLMAAKGAIRNAFDSPVESNQAPIPDKEAISRHNRSVMPHTARILGLVRKSFGPDVRLIASEEDGYRVGRGVGPKAARICKVISCPQK